MSDTCGEITPVIYQVHLKKFGASCENYEPQTFRYHQNTSGCLHFEKSFAAKKRLLKLFYQGLFQVFIILPNIWFKRIEGADFSVIISRLKYMNVIISCNVRYVTFSNNPHGSLPIFLEDHRLSVLFRILYLLPSLFSKLLLNGRERNC